MSRFGSRNRALLSASKCALVLASAGALVGLSTTAAAGAESASGAAPGVTAKTVTVGDLTDLTGTAASSTVGASAAFNAAIDQQNAEGGVNGRKIVVVTADGGSTPAGELSASQNLVQSHHVFAVGSDTLLMSAVANFYKQNSVPVVGMGTDGGPEWYADSNFFVSWGDVTTPLSAAQYTTFGNFFKKRGITKVGAIGYGNVPGSATSATGFGAGAKAVGLDPTFINTSSPQGGFNAASLVLGIQNSGAQGIALYVDQQDAVSLITAAKQAGLSNVLFASNAYGQAVLADKAAASAMNGSSVWLFQPPSELKTAATEAQAAALKKYAHLTGAPDLLETTGWIGAQLMIKGLEVAGKNPTRSSFMTNLRQVKNWNANGLQPWSINFADYQKNIPQLCLYFAKIKNDNFVPVGTKPVCGGAPAS